MLVNILGLLLTFPCVTLVMDKNPLDFDNRLCECERLLSYQALNTEQCTGSWARRRSERHGDIWQKYVWHTERRGCTTTPGKSSELQTVSRQSFWVASFCNSKQSLGWWVGGWMGSSPAAVTVSVLVGGAAVEIHF